MFEDRYFCWGNNRVEVDFVVTIGDAPTELYLGTRRIAREIRPQVLDQMANLVTKAFLRTGEVNAHSDVVRHFNSY